MSLHKQENHDILIKFLLEEKQFNNDRSKAACIVFTSLLQWRAFEADKTNIFDRIIQAIQSSFEVVFSKQLPMMAP